MTTIFHRLLAAEVKKSHDEDLLWSAKKHITEMRSSPQEAIFKRFFLEAMGRGDTHAIAACQKLYYDTADKERPRWECATCGCTDEFDIHGDLVCRCDSCSKGCESAKSRIDRGCKRPRAIYDATLAFGVVAEILDTLIVWYEIHDLLDFFLSLEVPLELKPIQEIGVEELTRLIDEGKDNSDLQSLVRETELFHHVHMWRFRVGGQICK